MCSAPPTLSPLAEDFSDILLSENLLPNQFQSETERTSTQWLPSATVSLDQLGYDATPFLTPYASSVPDTSPLPSYSTGVYYSPFQINTNTAETSPFPQLAVDPGNLPARPQSSPSFFGPTVEDLVWSDNALKFKPSAADDFVLPPATYQGVNHLASYFGDLGTSEVIAPHPQRAWTAIAPDPAGLTRLAAQKRKREEDEAYEFQAKRRRSTSTTLQVGDLGEEEFYLLQLKEEENLPWKDIAVRFQADMGKNYQVPALQMRYKRLRERLRVWTPADITALHKAHDYWEKYKFEIIGAKMADFGASEKWPARLCARKWQELYQTSDYPRNQYGHTATSSPMGEATLSYTPYMS